MILGEPTSAVVANGKMQIEGELYSEMPQAVATFALMKALKKRGKNLGLSIEGKVIERDPNNPSKIKRAKITGVAITPNPINSNTLCELVEKGFTNNEWTYDEETEVLMKSFDSGKLIDEDEVNKAEGSRGGHIIGHTKSGKPIYETANHPGHKDFTSSEHYEAAKIHNQQKTSDSEHRMEHHTQQASVHTDMAEEKRESSVKTEKAITASVEGPVIGKESVEGGHAILEEVANADRKIEKKVSKSCTYERIFSYFPTINIEKAKSVYSLIEKISIMKGTEITEEQINKAFEILNEADAILKAKKDEVETPDEVVAEKEEPSIEEEEKNKEEIKKNKMMKAVEPYKNLAKSELIKAMMEDGYSKEYAEACSEFSLAEANEKKDGGDITVVQKSLDNITELVNKSSDKVNEKFSALADITKAHNDQITDLQKSLQDVIEINANLSKQIETLGSASVGRKSIVTKSFVEKFEKSQEGEQTYSISNAASRKALLDKIEYLSGFGKSENFDARLMDIAQNIEIAKSVTPQDLGVLKLHGIEVVG
jgi:hypothetical protein